MAEKGGRRFWRRSRRVFRWFRIGLLLTVLLGALALVYLNEVGLPDFVKRRVVASLEEQGLKLEFSRLRLHGYRRIVVDHIRVGTTNSPAPIVFTAQQAELRFQKQALKSFDFKLEELDMDRGHLSMELKGSDPNAAGHSLEMDGIKAVLRHHTGDQWTLESFRGDSLGAHWQLSGSLTNVFALSGARKRGMGTNDWVPALRNILDTLERIKFSAPPMISMTMLGDLNDLTTFKAAVSLRSDGARTPWGDVDEVFFRSRVEPSAKPGEQMETGLSLRFKRAATPWAGLSEATLTVRALFPLTNTAMFESAWEARADEVTGKWAEGRNLKIDAKTHTTENTNLLSTLEVSAERSTMPIGEAARVEFHAKLEHAYPVEEFNRFFVSLLPIQPTNAVPDVVGSKILKLGQHWVGDWQLDFDDLKTKRGAARKLSVSGDVRERADKVDVDASWGFWRDLAPLIINWRAEASDFVAPEARIDKVEANGEWRAPRLGVAQMDSKLYGGSFHLDAGLDVATRRVEGNSRFDFDLQRTASLLDPEVRPFLAQFAWKEPPRVQARVALTLPTWTNAPANARDEIFRSTELDGEMAVGAMSFRGVSCTEASAHFSLTNFQWRLPDLVIKREEGQLELDYSGHAFKPEFRIALRGGVNPWAVLPLLGEDAQTGLKMVEFPQPPHIDGVLTGDLDKPDSLVFVGNIAATNTVVRGEPFLDLKSAVVYSNQWVYFTDPLAHRNTNEVLSASAAKIDLKKLLMYVTNGFSTTDPYRFTKLIGPITYNAIAPYKFKSNPTVRANGIIPLADADDADIQFQISGEDFSYWRFNLQKVSGGIYWHHQFLEVTNLTANFYEGHLDWEGHFHFLRDDSADYQFKGVIASTDLAPMLRDLLPEATNRLEGTLQGTLIVTEANSKEITTWKGHGDGVLKNGFLWDIPIFGIFSKPLDAVAPGLGKSKISGGAGTYRIENGKVYTKDMEVRAPAFRLKYDGTVDFDGNLDAKVEAEFFRDAWIFGRAVSVALWPLAKVFESKITGSLAAPKSELAHIPKIILFPLRPIQTLKELLPKDKEKEKEKQP